MSDSNDVFRLKVNGQVVTVKWDLEQLRGEMLDTIEDYLGVSVYGWMKRWQDALAEGVRLSEFRSREIVALVFLGMYQADPETTLQHVARSVAPYAIDFLPPEEAPKRTVQGPAPAEPLAPSLPPPPPVVDPDGHRDVPAAFRAPPVPQSESPLVAALGMPEVPAEPQS